MGAQQTEILQRQCLHILRFFFLVTLQIFLDSRAGLSGIWAQHMHYHTNSTPRALWSKTNFRKMQCLSTQHFWNWKRKLEVSDLFPRSWVQSSSITGYTSAIIVLLEPVLLYLPSISIRFHFIWIMAQDGNRSGQRLFSYQTLKKSITQKERHLQITVQSIPHKC